MFGIPGARMVAVVDPDPETETVAWTVLVADHGGDLGKLAYTVITSCFRRPPSAWAQLVLHTTLHTTGRFFPSFERLCDKCFKDSTERVNCLHFTL